MSVPHDNLGNYKDLNLFSSRLPKNTHLRRYPARSPSRGRTRSCSLFVATAPLTLPQDGVYPELVEGGALHLGIFEQPVENDFFSNLLDFR